MIKSIPDVKKVIRSIIDLYTKEGDCYDAWRLVVINCENRSSQIQGIEFHQ